MKAWRYRPERDDGSGIYIYLEDVPIPGPQPDELLLKVSKVSVCGTDEMLFAARLRKALDGIIPGHEFCGEIVEMGSDSGSFKLGQIVAGESHYRRPGSIDEGVIGLWPPRSAHGTPERPVQGAYAEYVCIPASCAHVISAQLLEGRFWPSLFEPAGNDFLLARCVAQVGGAASVGVFGCGPHGLYAQIFLRHFGIPSIVAFETDSYRRRFAQDLGCADQVIDPREGLPDLRFDVTIDMVGKSGAAFEQSCQLTREGGAVILFGLFNRDVSIAGEPANDLIFNRRELTFQWKGKTLKLVGITGREGVWGDLIQTVTSSPQLQERLMKPVNIVGSLDLLGEDARHHRPEVLKRAFSAFEFV
ncbi:MAG: zinc-dependent alcohol dehydrogenase [Acidobacteriota bacterium]